MVWKQDMDKTLLQVMVAEGVFALQTKIKKQGNVMAKRC
jgi:hypothetical protein